VADRTLSDHYLLVETRVSWPARPQQPDDFVVEHESTLMLPDDDELDGRPVAKLHWARVALGAACNAGIPTFDVLDAKSADLFAMYEALFDPATDELKAPFENDLTQDIVYFDTSKTTCGCRGACSSSTE
jgi:hypothetical protein